MENHKSNQIQQGIEIEYVMGEYPDTPEGNFMRHIRATVAEYEREKLLSCGHCGQWRVGLESERAKLDRLVDLYLTGEFSKELLAERRGRLETQIAPLAQEEVDALAVIEAQTVSDEQILAIQNFGREITKELDLARSDGEAD